MEVPAGKAADDGSNLPNLQAAFLSTIRPELRNFQIAGCQANKEFRHTKSFGAALLLIGFLWIMLDALQGFAGYQHSRWIWQAQRLPEGKNIERDAAVAAMRQMGLALKDRHRVVVFPAFLMLGGGLAIACGCRARRR